MQRPKYVSDAVFNFTHDDVARGRVIYYPLPSAIGSSAILEDAFTFVLTARNAQPVSDTLSVEVVPANYDIMGASPSPSSRSSSTVAPEVAHPVSTSQISDNDKIMLISLIVAALVLLVLMGLIIWYVIHRRNIKRRKLELAAAMGGSGTTPVASPSSFDHLGVGGTDDGPEFHRPPSAARRGAPPLPSLPVIIEPSSSDSGGEVSPTASTAAAAVIPNHPPSDSGGSRTGYVRVLPPSPPSSADLKRNGAPPGPPSDGPRSVWKEQVTFDWEHVDPELLQHCRKTNPVLHKNQYWV